MEKKYCKVRDHCHYTAKYRVAAHDIWDLKKKLLSYFVIGLYMIIIL